jgi:hypothetical protein
VERGSAGIASTPVYVTLTLPGKASGRCRMRR